MKAEVKLSVGTKNTNEWRGQEKGQGGVTCLKDLMYL